MKEWISYKKSPPPIGKSVIAIVVADSDIPRLKIKKGEKCIVNDKREIWEGETEPTSIAEKIWGKVTHWRYMPKQSELPDE